MPIPLPFTNLQQFKLSEIVTSITKLNINERIEEPLKLNFYDVTVQIQAGVTILEALCYMYSLLGQTSGNEEQRITRLSLMENTINSAYNKIISWEEAIWDGKDKLNNTTVEWLAWGGAVKPLKDLLNKFPELIEIEQKATRNAFDVAIEVKHLSLEQKKELVSILITKGITGNNFSTYVNILQNKQLFLKFKDNIETVATTVTDEKFFIFAYNIIYKLCILMNKLITEQKIEFSTIQDLKSSACELTLEILKQNKCNIIELLTKLTFGEEYKSSLLHWLLELGGNNIEKIVKDYDKNKELNFHIKDYIQNKENKSVLEWIANYRYNVLKELKNMGYFDPNKKEENLKILISLVENSSGKNSSVQVSTFFKSLLTHEPPLFPSKLDTVKQAICQKTLNIALKSSISKLTTTKYSDTLQDHNDCLIAIHDYEILRLGEAESNIYS